MFYRETIVAGKTIMRSLKAITNIGRGKQRKPKTNPTSSAVQKINFKNAVRMLTAKLNHNFKPGDYHIVLTHGGEAPSKEEAKKRIDNFKRNLSSWCKRNGIEFKWVEVTEYKHSRVHHHMVMTKIPLEVVDKYWKHGYEYPVLLDSSGNYYKLAEYLLKETEKTFRDEAALRKRRYSSSRNVIMPEIKREKVSGREVRKDIVPLKGYKVDEDTIKRYEHAILRVECIEYIMVSTEADPRYKKWGKGRKVRPEKTYRETDYEEQMSFDRLQF